MRPSSRSRWFVPLLALACGPVATPPSQAPTTDPVPAESASAPASVQPAILSAHLARVDDPELGGKDGVLVVFDTQVDAASLHARAFVITRPDGGPIVPERALLSPASEDDENRTVLLVGELHDSTAVEPNHVVSMGVAVIGPLWAEDGRPLQGLGAAMEPFTAGPRAVAAEVLAAGPGRCEGAAQVLRTYWSGELRGVEPSDLPRVRVEASNAAPVSPLRFDDHAAQHAEAGQDNVLDLCIDDPAVLRRVWIEAGAFRDPAGHASAAVDLRMGQAPVEPLASRR
jgi:hypothetical protein